MATGNVQNDNQALIIDRRFLMASIGNESIKCPSTIAIGIE